VVARVRAVSADSTHMHLEVISGSAAGSAILVEDELVFGRHELEGILVDDAEISRQHARISREASGEYAIEDLGSSNGTFVNGLQIQSPRLLAPGDSIEIGATTLVVGEIVRPAPSTTAISAVPDSVLSDQRFAPTTFAPVAALPDSASDVAPVSAPEPQPAAVSPPVPAPEPQPAAVSPPVSAPEPQPAPTPPLELKLEIDFDTRRARIALGDGGETIDLVFEDGGWRRP
jgi:hypothetical protein